MLVIAMETEFPPAAHPSVSHPRWAGRRHDDDRPGATSGSSAAELFDTVFRALHDGEQVALGFDCPLTVPTEQSQDQPDLGGLRLLLGELSRWRPWTTVSTSLAQWKANTSILVWQAVPAWPGRVTASAAADSFFHQLPAARQRGAHSPAGPVVNLAAAAVRRSGLFIDPSELTQPALTITVTTP
jgi:hypothetical protein